MNLKQLWAERKTAGAEYKKALETLQAAFVRLGAVERTPRNAHGGGGEFLSFHFTRNRLEEALRSLQHMQFAPRILVQPWHDRVTEVSDKQIEEFKP